MFCNSALYSLLDYYCPLALVFPGLRKPSFGHTDLYFPTTTVLVSLVSILHCLHNSFHLGFHYHQSAETTLVRVTSDLHDMRANGQFSNIAEFSHPEACDIINHSVLKKVLQNITISWLSFSYFTDTYVFQCLHCLFLLCLAP